MTTHRGPSLLFAALMTATLAVPLAAQESATPAKRAPIYDEEADANLLVDAALQRATVENKRVLLMYGGNWCSWCYLLDGTLESDPDLRRKMQYEYELVHVDIGRGEKHAELSARFGSDHRANGYPYLTVLAADGSAVTHKNTGELEAGKAHDPAKVLAFLEAHEAAPRDASTVLAEAQQLAQTDGRRLFVHMGAPWCGWCHRLEDWMAEPEVAALLAKDFIDVKIDQDRMTNGKLVGSLLRRGEAGGIPWIVLMDGSLRPLADADGPGGNVGFPVSPEEIGHFMSMLRAARQKLTDADLDELQASLQRSADKILAARKQG